MLVTANLGMYNILSIINNTHVPQLAVTLLGHTELRKEVTAVYSNSPTSCH